MRSPQHTSAYVSIRQHTSAYEPGKTCASPKQNSAAVHSLLCPARGGGKKSLRVLGMKQPINSPDSSFSLFTLYPLPTPQHTHTHRTTAPLPCLSLSRGLCCPPSPPKKKTSGDCRRKCTGAREHHQGKLVINAANSRFLTCRELALVDMP